MAFAAQSLNSIPSHTPPLPKTHCRKAAIMTVALIAITALTLALLSHFGCVEAGSAGTICLYAATGISVLGLTSLLARCRTDRSQELGRPSEPNRNYALVINGNEAIFTDQENGTRWRRPIVTIGSEDLVYIPFPSSWGEQPDIQTYVLVRTPDERVWAICHENRNHTLVNKVSPNHPLTDPNYNNLSSEHKVDPWFLHPDVGEVQILPRYNLKWQLPNGDKRDHIVSKIQWNDNPNFRFQYTDTWVSRLEGYISILGAMVPDPNL